MSILDQRFLSECFRSKIILVTTILLHDLLHNQKIVVRNAFISRDRRILLNDALAAACVKRPKYSSQLFSHILILNAQNKFPQAINRYQGCISSAGTAISCPSCRLQLRNPECLGGSAAAPWKPSAKIATLRRKPNLTLLTTWCHAPTRARLQKYNRGTFRRFLSHKNCYRDIRTWEHPTPHVLF